MMKRLLLVALTAMPWVVTAQVKVGSAELAHAKSLLEQSRADLTPEQWALLAGNLAATEQALTQFGIATKAAEAAAVVTEGGATVSTSTALSAVTRLLPLLIMVWPATAHAPGVNQETATQREARARLEESLKDLSRAARQVESERAVRPHPAPRPTEGRAGPEQPTLEGCLRACEGAVPAREAFCRSLPNNTPEERDNRRKCWEAARQSTQFCKNTCYAIFVY